LMQEQVDGVLAAGTLMNVYLDSSGNVRIDPVESTGADYSQALPAGSPKTNWPGMMTGQMQHGDGNWAHYFDLQKRTYYDLRA